MPGEGHRERRHLSTPVHNVIPVLCPGEFYVHTFPGLARYPSPYYWSWEVMPSYTSLSHPSHWIWTVQNVVFFPGERFLVMLPVVWENLVQPSALMLNYSAFK